MEQNPRIRDLVAARQGKEIVVSIEFFPPKTEGGMTSLYNLAEKLKVYSPLFADVTWGAGGSTSELTIDICKNLKLKGHVVNMHLTCTNIERVKVLEALNTCKDLGITNILALRGDPPAGQEKWEATEGGFQCALDLVRFIRQEHGDYFNLTVAGYPEGHPSRMTGLVEITVCRDADFEIELDYLQQKVDAGADCIITQLFFDAEVFLTFVRRCRERGIACPIIPGIMCVNSAAGFKRMIGFCKTRIPQPFMDDVNSVQEEGMKALSTAYLASMCASLVRAGHHFLHMYTLNTSAVTIAVLNSLASEFKIAGVAEGALSAPSVFDATLQKSVGLATA
ncbi:methylenetetrahydrofolate reductase [Ochromonadaceae sp. CCMP2298]|nr:methylenetetrahydrofolate reductase [Ochromonadaceae sp. CCMP2298]